jgi:hypothetical protein
LAKQTVDVERERKLKTEKIKNRPEIENEQGKNIIYLIKQKTFEKGSRYIKVKVEHYLLFM